MDTNQIKRFAIEARNKLKEGVAMKMTSLGFTKNGEVTENMYPALIQGGSLWNGQIQTETFFHQWMSLYARIKDKGMNEVYEEAAYTWFNRLVAIRILQKNGLAEPILDFADVARTPRIVDSARSGSIPNMREEQRLHLTQLLDDDTKTTEQFAVLITAWCRQNPIIKKCFGGIADYTELLLPNNILGEGGFMDMLNHTLFISDNDYQSPELIGWLYQFYISERKNEVFAKKGKYTADEIPAATQIFTPNWIVKYMVQNTVGRIYLDNNPSATAFKENWKYLVEGEPTPEENIYRYSELTDLKVADLACGSGHILNECFDILFELYIAEGYTRSEAVENIFRHNLTGIDLDKRAQQLATFALLLKACQKEHGYVDAHCLPNVLTMPKALSDEVRETALSEFMRGCETPKMGKELDAAFELMKDADSLGSIMKFDISEGTRFALLQAVTYWESTATVPDEVQRIIPAIKLILALTEKYSAIVMNPPYMGRGGMNDILNRYIANNYELGKWDLFAVFMIVSMSLLSEKGKMSMLNMHSWMFLSAFEELRKFFLSHYHIDNMIHLGPNTFDELTGEIVQNTTFVLSNTIFDKSSVFYRLTSGKNCQLKNHLFLKGKNCIKGVKQSNFTLIPGEPIAYWLNDKWFSLFKESTINDIAFSKAGIVSGNDDYYVKFWHEVNQNEIDFHECDIYGKYHIFQKGGTNRKYFGNNDYVFRLNDFWNSAFYNKSMRRGDTDFYFKEGICWSYTGSTENKAFRYIKNFVCGTASPVIHNKDISLQSYTLGLLNTKIISYLLPILNPTLSLAPGYVVKLPYIFDDNYKEQIDDRTNNNISISRLDWDAHETSWNFRENELVALSKEGVGNIWATINDEPVMNYYTLGLLYHEYKVKWEKMFRQLHANEEELNRQFIEIYGLQDELTPDVPLSEVTILQQGEIKINGNEIEFQADVVMKQLISYAIGCWMGRYRLDQPGLYIAHPDAKEEEIVRYPYGEETFTIDDDGIIPVLPRECPFDDNLQNRIADFVRIAFGNDSLAENLNFVEQSLGSTIEKYLDKEYWKDHKRMYQNRPIYWLWSSKKGAFKVISYMHRMDAYTAERVRSKYLLPYIEYLNNKIADLESRAAQLSVGESRKLDALRKAHTECVEYHERLQVIAEQAIAFDLDDGVVVNYAKFGDVLAKLK
jgi:hypothetical protein